ncbi:tRNA pseudouridine38-40 synthase [Bifidobacterium bohemicum]|uniref:tRNA pseudouridine synthase A n=1 Tax=Bifidobacterium bohemicum DSM 22767 TaxID=1437606 RepID=A0A086ZEE8_9BIFI|nr:tRNA pseudouridine(38-40) synthase TruA [Bifidobacterium bohemicum]KFI44898.1 tRNA pseudouridine synthase A [Bifidobacterium bohemicum DSM 22767]SCB96777.1 tRNA pseudouridine38-40 synthase [Bifidobacterium bohemicum]
MRLRIDLAYDGGGFYGWARQPELRTVQGELEAALHKVLRVPDSGLIDQGSRNSPDDNQITSDASAFGDGQRDAEADDRTELLRVTVAGRTDTGVHAACQVCHLDLRQQTLSRCVGHMDVPPTKALLRRLRHALPNDIAVHAVSVAPSGFDARFSALERTYVYRISDDCSSVDPRLRGFVLALDDTLDIESMNEAAAMTVGLHDFGSFSTPNPGGTTIREVKRAVWRRVPERCMFDDGSELYRVPSLDSGLLTFTIVADAFAHNMVRSLVNACVQVGRGRKSLDWFADKMANPVREGSTGPIAACGLTLEHVAYPSDEELASRAASIRARRTLP